MAINLYLPPSLLIVQISEELPEILDTDVAGLSDRPIAIFLPRLLKVCFILDATYYQLRCCFRSGQ